MCCRIQQFLCGCTLRHGAITATVLSAISALLLVIAGASFLFLKETFMKMVEDSTFSGQATEKEVREFKELVSVILTSIGASLLAAGVLEVLMTLFLGLSICLNNSCLVIPWLIGAMINIVITCLFVVLLLFARYFYSLLFLGGISFQIYLWIVVYNFHLELKTPQMYISAPIKT